jgi:diaminopimelate decarboxylase
MYKVENHLKDKNGILYIEDVNVLGLAEKYDTPLYVYSESRIKENYNNLFNTFKKYYNKFKLYYSIKANNNLEILKILKEMGSCADCSSPGEIYLAKKAGINDIIYSGIYYRNDELEYGIKNNAIINLDDIKKLKFLKNNNIDTICFRVNPGIGNGKFNQIVTGGKEAKFGIIEEEILECYKEALRLGFKKFGIHMMTGSCILDKDYFEKITKILMDIAGNIANKLNIKFEFINIGGGFGITYENNENNLNLDKTAYNVVKIFKEKINEYNLGNPYLFIEPGRYVIADSCILLTKVCSIKKKPKYFIGVDCGMNTLIRPMLYDAYHEILLANDLNLQKEDKVDIVGQICESTDIFAKNRMMPKIKEDYILAILNCGAYGFSMSSRYGGKPLCGEVLVSKDKYRLIRKRESLEDLESK